MIHRNLSRRRLLASAAGGAAGLAAAGLIGAPRRARAESGVLQVRMRRDISSLDPGFMVGGTEIDVQDAVLPRLAQYGYRDGALVWEPSPHVESVTQRDPMHIDFMLRPGLPWTNGYGELTAEDVKFSYERLKTSDWAGDWEALERVDVTGPHSGTLVLNTAFAPFWLIALAGSTGTILSRAATEAAGGKFGVELPASCGPYVHRWIPKQRVELRPNPDWPGPKPAFEAIDYIAVEEDKAAEIAYEAGEVDLTQITPATHVRWTKSPIPDTLIRVAGALQYMWLGMNTEHPKLRDVRVRKAIQHAVDVDSVIQGAYEGVTEKSYGIICPGLVGKRNETKYRYDPARARALLAEAGVSGLEVTLRTLNVRERVLAAQIIQANLGDAGITATVMPLDSGPFWDMGQESKGETWKELELWLMRFGGGPDPFEMTQWFVSGQVGVWNWERWKDPEFDDLFQKGLFETDPEERAGVYLRMQEIMEDTGAYVFINHEPETFAHRPYLAPSISPDGQLGFRNFTRA